MSEKQNDNRPKPTDFQRLIDEIDRLWKELLEVRSLFPHFDATAVGRDRFVTPEFYQAEGYSAEIHLGRPLTEEDIERLNRIGHWVNGSFVIRLFTILESLIRQLSEQKKGNPNFAVFKLLRLLRNALAHGRDPAKDAANVNELARKCLNYGNGKQLISNDGVVCLDIIAVLEPLKDKVLTSLKSLYHGL